MAGKKPMNKEQGMAGQNESRGFVTTKGMEACPLLACSPLSCLWTCPHGRNLMRKLQEHRRPRNYGGEILYLSAGNLLFSSNELPPSPE